MWCTPSSAKGSTCTGTRNQNAHVSVVNDSRIFINPFRIWGNYLPHPKKYKIMVNGIQALFYLANMEDDVDNEKIKERTPPPTSRKHNRSTPHLPQSTPERLLIYLLSRYHTIRRWRAANSPIFVVFRCFSLVFDVFRCFSQSSIILYLWGK